MMAATKASPQSSHLIFCPSSLGQAKAIKIIDNSIKLPRPCGVVLMNQLRGIVKRASTDKKTDRRSSNNLFNDNSKTVGIEREATIGKSRVAIKMTLF